MVHGCGWCRPLQQQKLLLEVGDHLHPLLKFSILCLHMVLNEDDRVGMGIHLLTSDVEQHISIVPLMLGLTKLTVSDVQLMVLL
jgi:hypothetical protein